MTYLHEGLIFNYDNNVAHCEQCVASRRLGPFAATPFTRRVRSFFLYLQKLWRRVRVFFRRHLSSFYVPPYSYFISVLSRFMKRALRPYDPAPSYIDNKGNRNFTRARSTQLSAAAYIKCME